VSDEPGHPAGPWITTHLEDVSPGVESVHVHYLQFGMYGAMTNVRLFASDGITEFNVFDHSFQIDTRPVNGDPDPPDKTLIIYPDSDSQAANIIKNKIANQPGVTLVPLNNAGSYDTNRQNLVLIGGWITNPFVAQHFPNLTSCEQLHDGKYFIGSIMGGQPRSIQAIFGCSGHQTLAVANSYPNYPPTCPEGQHLENGVCVDDDITCPPGQHLENGVCVDDNGNGDLSAEVILVDAITPTGRFTVYP
ncbi:unnamed protein product, partial [marine sediment metagenome]